MRELVIYTDGSASKTTKGVASPGGAAFVMDADGDFLYGARYVHLTTINRMEMLAVAMALYVAGKDYPDLPVRLVSDSEYVVKGLLYWVDGWKMKGWKTADKKPVKNVDCWKALHYLYQNHPSRVTIMHRPRRSTAGAVIADDAAGLVRENGNPTQPHPEVKGIKITWDGVPELMPFLKPP